VKNISNKEMGRPLEMMPKPDETSFIVTAHLKIKIFVHVVVPQTPFIYEMCAKLKREGF
jgi:hypothetical protein